MASPGLVGLIQCSRPDLVLISSDGQQSYTWRILLALHSPWVSSLLVSSGVTDCGLSCLSIPAPQAEVQALLASLASQKPLPANQAASLLRIKPDKLFRGGEKETEDVNAEPPRRNQSFFQVKEPFGGKVGSSLFQEQTAAEVKEEMDIEEEDYYDDEADNSDLPEPASFTCESVREEEVKINTDEEIGDHVVEILENITNTGKTTVTCYVDWKYKFGLKQNHGSLFYFACLDKEEVGVRGTCPARLSVRKSFDGRTGAVTYQALKLMGGAHNHGEQAERVLVDYAKYKLRIIVTEKKEWREKTMKQVYLDFVDSFTADMEEERKSLFSVIFPSYEKMQDNMRKWKKGRTKLEKEGNLVRNLHQ